MRDLTPFYKILGVGPNTPMPEVKRNYRELAKIYHPDNKVSGDATKMKLLNDAFDIVKSHKPLHMQNVKAAPKREDQSRFRGKNRIYRILEQKNLNNGVYSISFPSNKVEGDTVFHFMLDYDIFNLFIDKELILPATLDVTYKQKTIRVRIYEGY